MYRFVFSLLLCSMVAVCLAGQQSSKPATATPTQDTYALYAAAVNGLYDDKGFKDRKLLIENKSVSFECGQNSCNRLDVQSGCSGMRGPHEYPDQVAMQFHQALSAIEAGTWENFKQNNEHCGALQNEFPLKREYLWMEDSTRQAMIGKRPATDLTEQEQAAWSQYDKVYLSQPGFNADRTQGLLYLGVVCHEQCSWFGYLLFAKVNGEWMAVGHYTMGGH
jgi:hypothetical protein